MVNASNRPRTGGRGRKTAAWTVLASLTVFTVLALGAQIASAQAPAAAPPPPDLATRVADLEAYISNGTPKALSGPGPAPFQRKPAPPGTSRPTRARRLTADAQRAGVMRLLSLRNRPCRR